MPFETHPSLAVTGSQCLSACLLCPDTVAEGLVGPMGTPAQMVLEHPMGQMHVVIEHQTDGAEFQLTSAGLQRTARKLAAGEVFIPRAIWSGA